MSQPAIITTLPAPRLLAILAADAPGYKRLMPIDHRLTVELLHDARAVFRTACVEQRGRVVDMAVDSVLLAFDSAASALRCALLIQQRLAAQVSIEAGTLRLPFRVGVHLGDVIEKADGSVYGEGVDIAARLRALAEPDEVMTSQAIRDLLGSRPVERFEDAGEHKLKNVAESMRVWRALPLGGEPHITADPSPGSGNLRFAERYELQPLERWLLIDGEPVALGSRAFDLLLALAAQPGVLRTKNELMEAVWLGVVVEEGNLATQISALRKVLGGDVIVTIPGLGYRFAARLEVADAEAPKAVTASAEAQASPARPSAPLRAEAKLKTNLPQPLPALLGRVDDLVALGALIDGHRLVSIVGAGGMGKSLLTQHLLDGRRSAYTHGVCWVELGAVTDPALLPGTVAAALGLRAGGSDALQGLSGAVAPLQMLVALDNAEQVQDGVAALVQALLQAAPGVRLVVTSQAPLRLAQERVFRIGPLAVPDTALPAAEALGYSAVALFAERAHHADARFTLTDAAAPAAIELCRALDGLPLAIELAAARVPLLGVQRLAASMQDRLKLLTANRNRLAPQRQQTLRATLDWSHCFLDERERAVFRRLAVFAGSGSLAMIQQVVADPPGEEAGAQGLDGWAVLDALMLLVDRSLVAVLNGDSTADPRYRLLDSPRAFALERLKEADEEAVLRRRHMQAMAALCDTAWHAFHGGEIGIEDWLRACTWDSDNAREAMAQAVASGHPVAVQQLGAVRLLTGRNLPAAQRIRLAEQCIAQLHDPVPPTLRVRSWIQVARAYGDSRRDRRLDAARAAVDELRRSQEVQSDRYLAYLVWCLLATAAGRGSAGTSEVLAALAQARALEDPHWPAHRRFWRAEAEFAMADLGSPDALQLGRDMLALNLQSGGSGHYIRSILIDAELTAGETLAAASTGEALLADLQGKRDEFALAYTRLNLAAARLALDDAQGARSVARAGWAQTWLIDAQAFWADYLSLLAALEARPRAAARLAGYADAGYAASEDTREPNEATAHARACTLTRAALGDAEFDRLRADGRLLRDEQIEVIAFATDDTA